MVKKTNRKDFFKRKTNTTVGLDLESSKQMSLIEKPSIGLTLDVSLSQDEQTHLSDLLAEYRSAKSSDASLQDDLESLKHLTTEIKAIAAQSVLLHGERIQKAQTILKKYREGIFTKWLMQTYGNRTTPYSMLHFYNLYTQLKAPLKEKYKLMPKRAAYALAARLGDLSKKEDIVEQYNNQNQKTLIEIIQKSFPSSDFDRRGRSKHDKIEKKVESLSNAVVYLCEELSDLTKSQKRKVHTSYLLLKANFEKESDK